MDQEEIYKSTILSASPKHLIMAQSIIRDDDSPRSEEFYSWSPDMISSNLSPTQSPPSQVMERTEDVEIDHRRIPSSVFATESSTPIDWSAASNESLFSIHMNNTEELMKSPDLTMFEKPSSSMGSKNDMNNLNTEILSGSDELHVDEEETPQGDRESSPLTNHIDSQISNENSAQSKKKSFWSFSSCSFCTWPRCCSCYHCEFPKYEFSCGNDCWASLCCLNCKSKIIWCCSSRPMEISAPVMGRA